MTISETDSGPRLSWPKTHVKGFVSYQIERGYGFSYNSVNHSGTWRNMYASITDPLSTSFTDTETPFGLNITYRVTIRYLNPEVSFFKADSVVFVGENYATPLYIETNDYNFYYNNSSLIFSDQYYFNNYNLSDRSVVKDKMNSLFENGGGVTSLFNNQLVILNNRKLSFYDTENYSKVYESGTNAEIYANTKLNIRSDSTYVYRNYNRTENKYNLYLAHAISGTILDSISIGDKINYPDFLMYNDLNSILLFDKQNGCFYTYSIDNNKFIYKKSVDVTGISIRSIKTSRDGSLIVINEGGELTVYNNDLQLLHRFKSEYNLEFAYGIDENNKTILFNEKSYRIGTKKKYKKYPIQRYSLTSFEKLDDIFVGAAPLDIIIKGDFMYTIGKDEGPVLLEITNIND